MLKSFFLTVAMFAVCSLEAQDALKIAHTGYQYPIKPGSKEWMTFQTHDEMLAACTIPEATLAQLSAADLLASALNYPLMHDYMAYNDMANGLNQVIQNANVLTAFVNNKAAIQLLVQHYCQADPKAFDAKWDLAQQGAYTFQFITVELLLVHPSVQSQLSKEAKKLLIQKFEQNRKAITAIGEPYGLLDQNVLAYASLKMMPELFETLDATTKTVYEKGFSIAPISNIEPILIQLNHIVSQKK